MIEGIKMESEEIIFLWIIRTYLNQPPFNNVQLESHFIPQ